MIKIFNDIKKRHLTDLFIMQIHNQIVANDIKEAIQELCKELEVQDIEECEKVAQNEVFDR